MVLEASGYRVNGDLDDVLWVINIRGYNG